MSKINAIGLVLSLCMAPAHLAAASFDGSIPLLCASIEAIECAPGGDCHRGMADSVNIPQFLNIDFKAKTISASEEDGRKARIKNFERINGRLILQGVQAGRGWTVVISEETGKMSAAASDDQAGFVVFGACTPR